MHHCLNITLFLIYYILTINSISQTLCDNQSFKHFPNNDNLIEYSNSSTIMKRSQHLITKSMAINNNNTFDEKIKTSYKSSFKSCLSGTQCKRNEKCCIAHQNDGINKSFCIQDINWDNICKGWYAYLCDINEDCEQGFGLQCRDSSCSCGEDYAFSYQKGYCYQNPDNSYDSKNAMQIYKITMIFASCCLALILIIFLACILRRSYCPPRRLVTPFDNNTIPDIFTLFPHVGNYDGGPLADGTLPPFEKPPTYDETLTLIRNEIGIPPPAYRGQNSPYSTNPSTPDMCSRVMITSPTLMTVSDGDITSHFTTSGTESSSDISIAGPSGQCRGSSGWGVDNPSFVSL